MEHPMSDDAQKPTAPALPTLKLKPKAHKQGTKPSAKSTAKSAAKPTAKHGSKADISKAKPKSENQFKSEKQSKPDTQSMLKSRQICYELLCAVEERSQLDHALTAQKI